MAECVYNRGAHILMNAALTGTALDLRMAIVTGNSTGLIARTLNTVAEVDALNAGATNIHTERIALTGEASTEDDGNNRANVDSGNVAFAAAPGVTAVGLIIYNEGGGTDATRDLLAGYTTGLPQPVDGGLNVTITDFLRANALTA
jgi:hypothetical protein